MGGLCVSCFAVLILGYGELNKRETSLEDREVSKGEDGRNFAATSDSYRRGSIPSGMVLEMLVRNMGRFQ